MVPLADALERIITGYERAMARFDGDPCAECGDAFDHTTSNLFPVWSDTHDDLVCVSCAEEKNL